MAIIVEEDRMGMKSRWTIPERVELLRSVIRKLENRPERFNQAYACGTACCLAGHLAAASGMAVRRAPRDDVQHGVLIRRIARRAKRIWGYERTDDFTEIQPGAWYGGAFSARPQWGRDAEQPTADLAIRVLQRRIRQLERTDG